MQETGLLITILNVLGFYVHNPFNKYSKVYCL